MLLGVRIAVEGACSVVLEFQGEKFQRESWIQGARSFGVCFPVEAAG